MYFYEKLKNEAFSKMLFLVLKALFSNTISNMLLVG
jgi:hypothetical protein